MKAKNFIITGIVLLLLGISMLLFIAATFSYMGDHWRAISVIGEYCILLFIPVLLIGSASIIFGLVKRYN
ncbi:hypothetical protein [Pedobacter sp. BMA]|uniref:hypothetical protein n=1 Tax=Pedobacter sp. BMA TaxID=1663685 RepID=UPI00064B3936|nr:hypothetical protein [Pedobacter sp. BMA]KLT67475.1 hypothetical protein AB669_01930 [Pedobacter sp. BMA]